MNLLCNSRRRIRRLPVTIAQLAFLSSADANAQPKTSYDKDALVFREFIELTAPPPYLLLSWPNPPVRGYYAWRISFGSDSMTTIVFRTDSSIAARNLRDVIRHSALYRCSSDNVSVMECTVKIRGTARAGLDGLVLQITDPTLVARVRQNRPSVHLRQLFEPGGRFRVDHIGITYK